MTQEEKNQIIKKVDQIERELEKAKKKDEFISFVIIFTLSFLGSSLVTYFITK